MRTLAPAVALPAAILAALAGSFDLPAPGPAPPRLAPARPAPAPGSYRGPWFGEQIRERWIEPGVRVRVNLPAAFDPGRPTWLVVYATPNGSTIEQTLGCRPAGDTDWRFDIQHVAAQVRRLREVTLGVNVALAVVEAEGLSWPAWRRRHPDGAAVVRRVVETVRGWLPGPPARVALTGHSGGGSFLFGFLDAADAVPDWVDTVAFLDANYSYRDADRHGDKLIAWLRGGAGRRFVVIAYDDRRVMLDGKPVVGPTGGTFRATRRMLARFAADLPLAETRRGDIVTRTGLGGRVRFHVHTNPGNRILHTALVGEMNGLLEALTPGWDNFGGPRDYSAWVQPAAGIPPRPADAPGGAAFVYRLAGLSPAQRDDAIARELLRGNIPDFLRAFHPVTIRSADSRVAVVEVMPDYLAVGSDADFVRVPLTPRTAQRVADAFGCNLPTRKVVDEVYRTAAVRPHPRPLTADRESVESFLLHDAFIRLFVEGHPPGSLVAGVKKDVVVSNRLDEKPNRVAIYGWHTLDGKPIQPLSIVHWDGYVDYSHGVRLMRREVRVDGKRRDVRHVLHDAAVCGLLSDEGPVRRSSY
ncbi:MAG TPA: hypothetical protein VFG68_04495 [Fimbriiglobus sp.]|nr:hypothetical protein [Fimbriiglobus sp.]